MSRDQTLADHVQELLDERDYWLASPSPYQEEFPARMPSDVTMPTRQVEIIDIEIAEAVELLRKAGKIK